MGDRVFVVVVDDDASVRKALGRLLRIARMEVETYASAETFLVSLDHRLPDCLVLDIRMPGMTGLELRERLIALGSHVPIVFITAHAEDVGVQPDGRGASAEFLRKPFDDEALLGAIHRSIHRNDGTGAASKP